MMMSLSSKAMELCGQAIAQQRMMVREQISDLAGNTMAILLLGVDRREKHWHRAQGFVFASTRRIQSFRLD